MDEYSEAKALQDAADAQKKEDEEARAAAAAEGGLWTAQSRMFDLDGARSSAYLLVRTCACSCVLTLTAAAAASAATATAASAATGKGQVVDTSDDADTVVPPRDPSAPRADTADANE